MARTVRYHLGTLAKGSFIITLVKIPRLILTYIHSQLKGKVSFEVCSKKKKLSALFNTFEIHVSTCEFLCFEQENACARCMLKACVCCLWCLEKCLAYLNQVSHFMSMKKEN